MFLFQFCTDRGGYLIRLETAAESELVFINRDLIGIVDSNWFWMGVIKSNGQWEFDNNQAVTWTNWYSGRPNGYGDCVQASNAWKNEYGYEWFDLETCGSTWYALCEA